MLRLGFFLVSFFSLAASVDAAGLDQYLVARWTFNSGSLKAEQGDYVLRELEVGSDPWVGFDKGQVTLGPGALLVCEEINAQTQPGLAKAVTLWVRLRFDGPVPHDSFVFGLRDKAPAGDWKNMVLAVLARNQPENLTTAFSRFAAGTEMSSGKRSVALETGRFFNVAIVFDGASNAITYVVDGQSFTGKHQDASALAGFGNFSIGRLKAAAGVAMTVDEVRIYSVALSPEWVADITPVK